LLWFWILATSFNVIPILSTHDGHPCLKDCCMLVCCCSADMQYSTVCEQIGATICRYITRAVVLGLWKCDCCWHSQVPTGPSAVDLQFSSTEICLLICRASKYDHVSPLLQNCIGFLFLNASNTKHRLAVLVFCCWYDMAPEYMARDLQWASDTDSRQRLRSSSSHQPIMPRTRLFTLGNPLLGATAAHVWNSVPLT